MKKSFFSLKHFAVSILTIMVSVSLFAFPGQTAKHKQIYKSLSAEDKAQFDALPDGQKLFIMQRLEMEQAAKEQEGANNIPGVGVLEEGDQVDAYMDDAKVWFKGKFMSAMVVDGKKSIRVRSEGWNSIETVEKVAKYKSKTGNKPNPKLHPRDTPERRAEQAKAARERRKENERLCLPIQSKDNCMRNYPRCSWDNASRKCIVFQ